MKDTFTYTITDADGDTSTTTIVIDIKGNTDYPPVAVNDSKEGTRDANGKAQKVTQKVTENDSDADGTIDKTSIKIVGADAGSNGKTKTVAGEGVWTVDDTTGEITFTPEDGYTGNTRSEIDNRLEEDRKFG